MEADEIRKLAKARPFRAFEIRVENGEKYTIPHPENIFITDQIMVTVDENGRSVFIAPEAVSTLCLVESHKKVDTP